MTATKKCLRPIVRGVAAGSLALGVPALADDVGSPTQMAEGSFAASNPNLAEWTLVHLQATDTASALDGAGVKVAVLDGKADCRNSALTDHCQFNALPGATYSTYNTHGTHVSGIIAGNPFGIAPAATILNYGVYADAGYVATGTKLSDTWKSAYAAGAQISSMSFGCTRKALCFSDYDLNTMASSSLPMLYVKAAGNDGADLVNETTALSASTAAAALNRILIVGSVNGSGRISSFSNRPGTGCLLAQTSSVCSAELSWKNHFLVAPGEAIYSSLPNNTFGYMSGTSMATPVVAGAAALLEARWPFLKNSPETLAKILLTSATDLGDPGVDSVYGYGLLNISAAFVASGSVTIVAPVSSGTTSTTTTTTTSSAKTKSSGRNSPKRASIDNGGFGRLGEVLGSLTVFDAFGRDFRWDETGTLAAETLVDPRSMPSRRLLGAFTQADWKAGVFSSPQVRSFAFYGSRVDGPNADLLQARELRLGVDMPIGKVALQVRLTGSSNTRNDFTFDSSMRALAFFPSTDLASSSLITNLLLPVGKTSRLMVYSIAGTGAIAEDLRAGSSTGIPQPLLASLSGARSQGARSHNNGIGMGVWKDAGSGVVVGANLSLLRQKNGLYDAALDVAGFDRPTYVANAGFAVSKASDDWDFYLSGELSRLQGSSSQAIGFSPTSLISAEAGMAKSGLLFRSGATKDSFRLSLSLTPRAVGGSLRLNYMTPTGDGMDVMPTERRLAISELGHKPARLAAAYQIRAGSRWAVEFSGGADLERTIGQKKASEGLVSFRTAI